MICEVETEYLSIRSWYLPKTDETFFDITEVQQLAAKTLVDVGVAAVSSWIPNELGNAYHICRRSWCIATKVDEIDNFQIKIVLFFWYCDAQIMSSSKYKSFKKRRMKPCLLFFQFLVRENIILMEPNQKSLNFWLK